MWRLFPTTSRYPAAVFCMECVALRLRPASFILFTVTAVVAAAGAEPQPGPADIAEAERDNAPRGIEGWCRIHDCAMQAREKDGHTWYSHKAPDDTWCRGAAKKGKK